MSESRSEAPYPLHEELFPIEVASVEEFIDELDPAGISQVELSIKLMITNPNFHKGLKSLIDGWNVADDYQLPFEEGYLVSHRLFLVQAMRKRVTITKLQPDTFNNFIKDIERSEINPYDYLVERTTALQSCDEHFYAGVTEYIEQTVGRDEGDDEDDEAKAIERAAILMGALMQYDLMSRHAYDSVAS